MAKTKVSSLKGIYNAQNQVDEIYRYNKNKTQSPYNYVYATSKKDGSYSVFLDSKKNEKAVYTKTIGK